MGSLLLSDFLKSLRKCTLYIVNIYLCIFFLVILTEILVLLLKFFQEKKKQRKKKRESPLRTEALCDSSFSVQWAKERLFLLICTEKQKWGRAGNLILFQTLTGHFDEFTSQLRAQERTSRSWLVTFQNGSGSG